MKLALMHLLVPIIRQNYFMRIITPCLMHLRMHTTMPPIMPMILRRMIVDAYAYYFA